jgi:hypothetical protein
LVAGSPISRNIAVIFDSTWRVKTFSDWIVGRIAGVVATRRDAINWIVSTSVVHRGNVVVVVTGLATKLSPQLVGGVEPDPVIAVAASTSEFDISFFITSAGKRRLVKPFGYGTSVIGSWLVMS